MKRKSVDLVILPGDLLDVRVAGRGSRSTLAGMVCSSRDELPALGEGKLAVLAARAMPEQGQLEHLH